MDPVLLIGVPGVLGGLVIALVMFLRQRRGSHIPSLGASIPTRPLSTDVINAASIKVAGIGGLGLVAMAVAVALNVPRIGQTLGIGLILGVAFAVVMIVSRRRTGSMPSSGRQAGANTTLAIEAAEPRDPRRTKAPKGPMDLAVTGV
ncbi:MAG: hypothetical protein M3468_08360 [Acidobacteriota bacterium]|nr:hypothetical protein [Acidobacteriota bacterium]